MKTLADWAAHVGVSTTVLRQTCQMMGVKPHDARDLMRALSAMLRSAQIECPPAVLLDIADYRTLRSFRQRAGPNFQATMDISSIGRFLESQQFVDPANHGLRVLRSVAAELVSQMT